MDRSKVFSLVLSVALLFAASFSFSQEKHSAFENGKIMFKFKENNALEIVSDNGRVKIADVPFIADVSSKYDIAAIEKPFYTANPAVDGGKRLLNTYLLKFGNDAMADDLISYLKKSDLVEYAEKVPVVDLSYIPDDSLYVPSISGANPKWLYQLINAETAWDYSHGDPNIKVAVIDNAIWTDHPDLQGKFVEIKDFADNDNNTNPYSFANDAYGRQWSHGTHVTGLVGAITDNHRGIASIGFNISLMAYKMYTDGVLPLPNLTAGMTAIQWAADHGANVINMSWGTTNQMAALQDAVTYAYNLGCVVVAAAGNDGAQEAYYPAACDHVIAVTSVGMDDKISYFSNWGSFVDLSSPGGYGPTDAGTWSPVSTTSYLSYSWVAILGSVRYDGMVGTSMAAPVVSGLCGLMLSLDSTLTPDQVELILKNTSVNVDSLNPSKAGLMGTGRINAGAAMAYVFNHLNGIEETKNSVSVNVFPNPCNGTLSVDYICNSPVDVSFQLLNMLGETMFNSGTTPIFSNTVMKYNLSHLSKGVYFARILSNGNAVVKKIVIGE